MRPKERLRAAVEHREPDRVPLDFGGSFITCIHCSEVENLRHHYALELRPVKVCEPYQMLGLVEDDPREAMGIDTVARPHAADTCRKRATSSTRSSGRSRLMKTTLRSSVP